MVVLRPPTAADRDALVSGRDDRFKRFMGEGSADPRPTFCITLDGGEPVGWVDWERDGHDWLTHDEVNVGYALHPHVRGRGLATRAVLVLVSHLARTTDVGVATLAIDADNVSSLAVARRSGFTFRRDLEKGPLFERPVPPLSYTDGTVTIRPLLAADTDNHLAAIDDEQIDRLWLPGQRESWEAMSPERRRDHVRRWASEVEASAGRGPRHVFAVEAGGVHVGHLDCDLANEHVPHGEANVAYSMHPDHRGRGHTSRAVRLALRFLVDHTAAREAHVVVDATNEASLRVARSVGAAEVERWTNGQGHTMVRHVVPLARTR